MDQAAFDGPPRRKARSTWIYVVVGILALCALTGTTVVVGGIMLFNRHVHSQTLPADAADTEFTRTAARFPSQSALIELDDDSGDVTVHRTPDRPRREIAALHVLAYDADDERLISITVPGWLLRLAPSSGHASVRIDGIDGLDGRGHDPVSLEDLERHGPGLVLDGHDRRRGGRVLVWTE